MSRNEMAVPGGDIENQPNDITIGQHRVFIADSVMKQSYELIRRLARGTVPILIQGETGSGKELAAAAVHAFSGRSAGPFVSINCAAIPEQLAESELFGHERGAFSGAVVTKPGLLELAHGGTVLLDELGELPLPIQAKLLRVIETREILRVGDTRPRPIDIRIVAATNRDLSVEVESGRFRSDLYFRIGVAQVSIQPLRNCPLSLTVLPARFLADACAHLGRTPLAISAAASELLFRYRWPGNVRELKHAMDYAAAAANDAATEIGVAELPLTIVALAENEPPEPQRDGRSTADPLSPCRNTSVSSTTFRLIEDEVRELERTRMIEALAAMDGIQTKAAELIGMPLRTFVTKLKRYSITPGRRVL